MVAPLIHAPHPWIDAVAGNGAALNSTSLPSSLRPVCSYSNLDGHDPWESEDEVHLVCK